MTNEECLNICQIAIKCFESKYSKILPVNNDCLEDLINQISEREEERQAINLIISALEKQMPKKMETKKCICYDGEEREYEVCANCGTQVRFAGTMTADYCWNCGQRVL